MKKRAANIRSELLKLSVRKKVPFQNIVTMFLLERMVARITVSKDLFNTIVFKGGYVALRVFNSERYTVDLDAIIKNFDTGKIIEKALKAVEKDLKDGVWFKYERKTDLLTTGEYGGTRLVFRCGIGVMTEKYYKSQVLHLDIATGDNVYPSPQLVSMTDILGEGEISWQVYTVESSVSEKLHTLLTRGSANSRSKDVYDLNTLLTQCDIGILKEALIMTFKARNDKFPASFLKEVSGIDTLLLERGWKSAIAGLKNSVSIEEAFETIRKYCQLLDDLD